MDGSVVNVNNPPWRQRIDRWQSHFGWFQRPVGLAARGLKAAQFMLVACARSGPTAAPAITLLSLLLAGTLASEVAGQLRTGRGTRSLYRHAASEDYREEMTSQDGAHPGGGLRTTLQPSVRSVSHASLDGRGHVSNDRRVVAASYYQEVDAPDGNGTDGTQSSKAEVSSATEVAPSYMGPMSDPVGVQQNSISGFGYGHPSIPMGQAVHNSHAHTYHNGMRPLLPTLLGIGRRCGDTACDSCVSPAHGLAPTAMGLPRLFGDGPLMRLWCRMSVRAEVPLYWRRGAGPPALATTGGTDPDLAGQLGESTTDILLGDEVLDESVNAGFRLTLGTRLQADPRYRLMFRYWNAGDQDNHFSFDSDQFPVLARPFLDTSGTPTQDTQLIAFPGESVGNITVDTTSAVDGLEVTVGRQLYQDRFTTFDWISGYQHVSIDEGLAIRSNTTVTGGDPTLIGSSIAVADHFNTENSFHGTFQGFMSTRTFACWKLETMFRLGLGNLRRQVHIQGMTTTSSGGTTATDNQGLLARNTNSQPFRDDTFIVLPEVGINLAYMIRPGLDFSVGYNYMLIPKVAQASQQINDDLAVNLSEPLVGSLDPELNFDERNFWLHSLGLGLQLRY